MAGLRYLSVCSGIEAATAAWHGLGWQPAAFAEIEPFPCAVLAHHYPHVPNRGDMTRFEEWPDEPVDLLVGGTPCQSFSVAGLRAGLADPRGNLMLTFGAVAARHRARWLVWENVPGVLSSNGGRDFGAFLGMLGQLGYGFAYRVLDAQFFGVPQRRRRVFVVGCLGGWQRAAAVLFERHSLSGHPAPRREAGEGIAASPALRAQSQCSHRPDSEAYVPTVSPALKARDFKGPSSDADGDGAPLIAHRLRAEGFDASEDGTGRGTPLAPIAFGAKNSASQSLSASERITPTLDKSKEPGLLTAAGVRRLTPRECERLQGFPDDYTAVPYRGKPAADGPRYKALGNSMAVPVMAWIGERIAAVEALAPIPLPHAA